MACDFVIFLATDLVGACLSFIIYSQIYFIKWKQPMCMTTEMKYTQELARFFSGIYQFCYVGLMLA